MNYIEHNRYHLGRFLQRRRVEAFTRKPKRWAAYKLGAFWKRYRGNITPARRRINVSRNAYRKGWELQHPRWGKRLTDLQRTAIRKQFTFHNKRGILLPRSSVFKGIDRLSQMDSLKGPFAMGPMRIKTNTR